MVADWQIESLIQFVEGFGLDCREQLKTGKLSLSFADGDVLYIELAGEESVDFIIGHEMPMADSLSILENALRFNHFSRAHSYSPNAYCVNQQLALRSRLAHADLTQVAMEQTLESLKKARVTIMGMH